MLLYDSWTLYGLLSYFFYVSTNNINAVLTACSCTCPVRVRCVWSLVSSKIARSLYPVKRQSSFSSSSRHSYPAYCAALLSSLVNLAPAAKLLARRLVSSAFTCSELRGCRTTVANFLYRCVCWRENKLVTVWRQDWSPSIRASSSSLPAAEPFLPASFVSRVFPPITWQPMKRKMWLMIFSFLAGSGVSHSPTSLPFCPTLVLLSDASRRRSNW